MRSLVPLPTRGSRRGLGALAVTLLALTSGCAIITGIPDVTEVDVSVAPDSIPVGATAIANGVIFGKNHSVLNTTKVRLGFTSENPSVATVNSTTGAIIGVSEGKAVIRATAKNKSATDTIIVFPQPPVSVQVQPPTLYLNGRVQLVITPVGQNGQALGKRALQIASGNTGIVAIETDGTTTGTFVRGVTVGTTTVSGSVSGTPFALSVTVLPPIVGKVQAALAKGTNTLLEGESNQLSVLLFAPDGTQISTAGQTITFQSEDQTTASVGGSGIVTGLRAGVTNINVIVAGSTARGQATVTVLPVPAKEVRFTNRAQFLRLSSTGTGVPSTRVAIAYDSGGRQLTSRQITYRSTDPSVFTVSSVTGTVIGQKLGSALLIASADNGVVADTLPLTVTPVPIVVAAVSPSQSTLTQDQTQQFTVTLTDSLAATVTGRPVTWFSSSPQVLQVDPATGLATALGAGTANVTVQVLSVPGFPGFAQVQAGSVLVLPKPVASIAVLPSPIALTAGRQTQISLTLKDASGNTIFTGRTVSARVADPTIASVQAPQGTGTGSVTGLKAGKTTITFQALDQAGNPQGAPTVVDVNVDP